MEDVSLGQVNFFLQVNGAHGLDAGFALGIRSKAFLDRFVEVLVDPSEVFLQGDVAGPLIIFLEQAVGHVQSKQG